MSSWVEDGAPAYERAFLDILPKSDLEALMGLGCKVYCVGSRTIEGAYQKDSDYDFLVLSKEPIPATLEGELGYVLEDGGKHYEPSQGQFNSFRCANRNIILTYSKCFARQFRNANKLAVQLKLKSRKDRVALFQAILYSRFPSESEAA